jgi:hypothetical protein
MKTFKSYTLTIITCLLISNLLIANTIEKNWTSILKETVTSGTKDSIPLNFFNYTKLQKVPRLSTLFDQIIIEIESFKTDTLKTEQDKLAFWINAYNIGAVKMIINNYPLKSIKDQSQFLNSVWDQKILTIEKQAYSLRHIEHKILRKMNEPLIHFAIVCASVSCPDIRPEAYTAKKLEKQLNSQLRQFLGNEKKGFLIEDHKLNISKIFSWFRKDFDTKGGVKSFLSKTLGLGDLTAYDIDYLDYNWELNEQ